MKKRNLEVIRELLEYRGNKKTYILLLISVVFIASSNFLVSFMLQQSIDAATNQMLKELVTAGILLIIISIFCGIFYYLYGKEKEKLKQEIAASIKTKLFGRWAQSNFDSTKTIKEGEMITYITEDADKSAEFVAYTLFPLLQIVLSVIIGSIYTLFYAWQIFLLVLFLAVFLVLILSKLFSRIETAYDNRQEKIARQKNLFIECLQNSDIIKINLLVNPILLIHKIISEKRVESEVKLAKEKTCANIFMENGILMIEMIVLFVGVILVRNQFLTIGTMVGVWNAAIGTFVYPLMDFPEAFSGIAESTASFRRIKKIIDLPGVKSTDKVADRQHEIQLEKITYKEDETVILDNISLRLRQKELVVIEGESGGGKSTLARVLLGQERTQSGEIYFNSEEKDRNSYGMFFSYVPQGNSLLNISLKENIMLDNKELPEDEINKISDYLKLGERIRQLPKKWDSIVQEDVVLSEGEAQRIAIIRAMQHKAPFLLLDEPFSALDQDCIHQVVEVLNQRKQSQGVIIITHKIPEGLEYDRKYVMEGGHLYEE